MGNKNIIKSDKSHRRYLENMDFMQEVMDPHIKSVREKLEAEINSMDIIDEVMHKNIMSSFDDVIEKFKSSANLETMSKRKIRKHPEKAIKLFNKKIKPRILEVCQAVHESKMTAKHGGALEEGFEISYEWKEDVKDMLRGYRNKNMQRKSGFDGFISALATSLFVASVIVTGATILASILRSETPPIDVRIILAILWNVTATLNILELLNSSRFDYGEKIARFIDDINKDYLEKAIEKEKEERRKRIREDYDSEIVTGKELDMDVDRTWNSIFQSLN